MTDTPPPDATSEPYPALRLRDPAGEAGTSGRALLKELARLAARLDAPDRPAPTREERLRLDPLRLIPRARLLAAAGPEPVAEVGPFVLDAGDPDFTGFGWWQAERIEGGSLRWSGAGRCATLLLPALGGGGLVLTLCLRAPFGLPFDLAAHDLVLDGQPLSLDTLSCDGVVGTFAARATLPELPAGARIVLLLHGPLHEDPDPGPRRDTRRIGLGLVRARLERA